LGTMRCATSAKVERLKAYCFIRSPIGFLRQLSVEMVPCKAGF
jgi:hypothetical protein